MQPECNAQGIRCEMEATKKKASQGIRVILISWFTLFGFSPPSLFHLTLMNISTLTENQKVL